MIQPRGTLIKIVLAGAILYCTGGVVFFVIPALLDNVARMYRVSPADLGMLPALELWGIALASLTGPLWINRFSWRLVARVSALISLVGQLASLLATHFDALLIVRFITGALGEGPLLALSYSLLGQTRNVERSFSLAYGASIVLSMVSLYASPQLDRALGTISVLVVLAVLSAAAFFASFLIPAGASESADQPQQRSRTEPGAQPKAWRALGALALLVQAVWFASAGGFWAFTEQLAANNAVPATEIAAAIAIGTGAALLGALAALGLNGRLGRTWPTAGCTLIMSATVFAFMASHGFTKITLELSIFNICWACGTIYLSAATCAIDESGKVAVLVPAFQVIGDACGTFVLGHVIGHLGFDITPVVIAALFTPALLLFLLFSSAAERKLSMSPL